MFRLALRVTKADLGGGGGEGTQRTKKGEGGASEMCQNIEKFDLQAFFPLTNDSPNEFSRFGNFSILKT